MAGTETGYKLADRESYSRLGKGCLVDKEFVGSHRRHWDCWGEKMGEDAASLQFAVKSLFYFWKLNHFESANAVT